MSTDRPHPPLSADEVRGLWLGLIGVLIFSLTLPMTRLAVGSPDAPQLSGWFVAFGRAAVAGILSLFFLAFTRAPRPAPGDWPLILAIAAGAVFGFPLFTSVAMRHVEAVHASVMLGVLPLATALVGAWANRQRPSAGFWACAALGSALVMAFAVLKSGAAAGSLSIHWADGLLLAAEIAHRREQCAGFVEAQRRVVRADELEDAGAPAHGDRGPIRVRRAHEIVGATASFIESAAQAGYPWVDDVNDGATDTLPAGIGLVPSNIVDGVRTGAGAAFLVPADAPGLVVAERIDVIAPHPLARLRFDACRVPKSSRIGAPGEGFKIAMRTLDVFRTSVAAAALGFARRALHEGLQWAKSRAMFGQQLADFQLTQAKLAQMATTIDSAALLTYRAAWQRDQGRNVTREAAMAKMAATEGAQQVIDAAVQLWGGAGVVSGNVVESLYREIRSLRIYEGATEVQQLIIGKDLLKEA